MADLPISHQLADKLFEIARHENRSLEDVLTRMVERYEPEEPPRPARGGLADENIDVPADVLDKAAYRDGVRRIRPKLYRIARRYWQEVGDQQRLALTDEDLDEQFWLIDPDGIPRLKSEQGTIEIPPDPLEALIGLIDDAPTDLSTSVRETMAAHYQAKLDNDSST